MAKLENDMNLQELKASAGDPPNETSEPVTPAGGSPKKNRNADSKNTPEKADEIDDKATPENKKPKVSESIEDMFAGSDLSEDFKTKAAVIFETAVEARAKELSEEMQSEWIETQEAAQEEKFDSLVEKVDQYLDYVVEKWLEENELAIESGIKSEIAESFFAGIYDLMETHGFNIPEEKIDVVESLSNELEESKEALDNLLSESITLKKELMEARKSDVLDEASSDLTQTQREKLEILAEGIVCENIEDFETKLSILKENYFGGGIKNTKETLTEDLDVVLNEENETPTNPIMAKYSDAISRASRNK